MFLGRVVGPSEPAWLDVDRDKAVWWLIHQRQTCQNCGTRAEEWESDKDAYVPEPHFCRGCEVKARADDDFAKAPKNMYRRGTTMQLRPRSVVEAEAEARSETEDAEGAGPVVGGVRGVSGVGVSAADGGSGTEERLAETDPRVR